MKLTVQPGDTLGRLTQLALKQAAPDSGGGRLPFPQLMQKVQSVAAQNQISNPDRIFPGQVIDFSTVVSVPAPAPATATAVAANRATPTTAAALGAPFASATAPVTQPSAAASPHRLLEQTLNRAVARGYIPSEDLSAVRGQILEMSAKYGFAPDDFARIALIESDGFNPKASNGNCHGVIQFCDGNDRGAASVGFGQNPKAILRMSVREQLTLVDQYFQDTGLQNYKAPSLETLYLTVLFPAARDERQPHRPLPIPGPQASALHVRRDQDGPITRASVRRGLIEHANLRLAQFTREQTQDTATTPTAERIAPAELALQSDTGRAANARARAAGPDVKMPQGAAGGAVKARNPGVAEVSAGGVFIAPLPALLPNFSVPSVSTQSVLNARRQS
ncbi:MAG: hypothetical protein RLZZ344_959 [Pseudomonadota bacterium]|jgi:hypothetical protein